MKQSSKLIAVFLTVLTVTMIIQVQISRARAPTDVTQTVGPVVVSTSTAIALCSTLTTSPGSAISGGSGVLVAFCPGALNNGAIWFPTTSTEIPTFSLSVGFYNMSIQMANTIYNGVGCTMQLRQSSVSIGISISSGTAVQFSTTTNTTLMTPGIYDYCLWYSQPLITGIAAFGISWNP